VEIATIGFTRSTASSFFGRLAGCGLPLLIDTRLNNTSQLAGFAKKPDLEYFLHRLCGMAYREEPLLAPDENALRAYRAAEIGWDEYAARYLDALAERDVAESLGRSTFEPGAVLLCSEATPERCHRRLAAEYLATVWNDVTVRHL
jgi:uncharacterized protein (DUF488 family)